MSWNPSDTEVFVFKQDFPLNSEIPKRVVLLIPGGDPSPSEIDIDGDKYWLDEEMTDQTRMHVRVSNRKRGLAD